MKHLINYLLLLAAGCGELPGQTLSVWPGDANNNGLVNNIDLLQIGMAYNYFGPSRDSIFVGWQAQNAQPWPLTLGNGVNAAYVDADGNGLVNYFHDAFPIFVHYGNVHGIPVADPYPLGIPGIDPVLFLDSSAMPAQIQGGMMISLPLVLGTADLPLEDFYGVAFSLHADPAFVDVDQISFNFNQPSWANPDNDRIYSSYRASSSRLDVGWVRTDHNVRSGNGPIGMVSIIIIDNVVSLEENFQMVIDSIHLIDHSGNLTAIAGDTLTVRVQPKEITGSVEQAHNPIHVWPNPVAGRLYLQAFEPIRVAALFDALGHKIACIEPDSPTVDWLLPDLPAGIYMLEIQLHDRVFRKKIIVN